MLTLLIVGSVGVVLLFICCVALIIIVKRRLRDKHRSGELFPML